MDIRTPADYQQALDQFTAWMDHEPADLTPMLALRDAISAYEKGQGYELAGPQTLVGRRNWTCTAQAQQEKPGPPARASRPAPERRDAGPTHQPGPGERLISAWASPPTSSSKPRNGPG